MPRTMTLGALRTCAALLLVDGRFLPTLELAAIALPWQASPKSVVGRWIPALRRAGCRIETADFRGSGYRLLAIPPDAILDDVLTMAHQLRQEHPARLWQLFGVTCPTRATASPVSSVPRSA